jgi:hypothetical protein
MMRCSTAAIKLLERLYRMADGEYVRAQVRVFNGERRLLAWRVAPGWAHGQWQAGVGAAAAATTAAMPVAAARLFAGVGQGWAPWQRIAAWPETAPSAPARLTLALAQPARGGETLQLMLIGRAGAVQGARLRSPVQHACSGRACPSRDAVQVVVLELLPGARSVSLDASALDMGALAFAGDQQYRHLRVAAGRLDWQPLSPAAVPARPAAPAQVTLEDRNGVPLRRGGAPTRAAIDAGLAPPLGIRAGHGASIAGMLGRLRRPALHTRPG